MEYRTFYKEGEITCAYSNNLIDRTEGIEINACRKRCDYRQDCKFFFYSHFSTENSCLLFKSCDRFQSMKGDQGTTYAKIRRSKM